ncbi:MAG: biotin/lipoyl-binding protein [Eubacterium sp.]|nr:biotin/lipoyl-binding protein [Eubacterium sp.]
MKSYTITVNGKAYDVTVEEKGVVASAPASVPGPATPKVETKSPVPSGNDGDTPIKAPMPGKVMSIKVKAGEQVSKGDTIMVFEAMKMENSVVAPADGTIASVNVEVGEEFESGAVLATM